MVNVQCGWRVPQHYTRLTRAEGATVHASGVQKQGWLRMEDIGTD